MPAKKKAAKKDKKADPVERKQFKPKAAYIIIGAAIMVAIIVVVIGLGNEAKDGPNTQSEIAAKVNGESIFISDIEAQYAILPDQFKGQVTKDIVLTQNIEKVLLLQEAEKKGIKVSDEKVEAHVNKIFSDTGFDEAVVEDQLLSRGLTMGDIRDMYREQLIMLQLINMTVIPHIQVTDEEVNQFYELNQENLGALDESRDQIISLIRSAKQPQALSSYVEGLKSGADIKIYKTFTTSPVTEEKTPSAGETVPRAPATAEITTFTDSGKEICRENGKPIIYLFTTTWCPHCTWIAGTYDKVAKEYESKGLIEAYHYELDTGDDSLTPGVETAVPAEAKAAYEKFNPRGSIPTFVFGCRYSRIGNGFEREKDLLKEEAEFRSVIEALI